MRSSALFPWLAAAATILLWASAFPFITLGLRGTGPIELAAMRFASAGLVMAAMLAIARSGLPRLADLWRIVACGALGIALYNILLNTGQKSVSPGAAAFLIAIQPIFTAILAERFLGERFGLGGWIGTAVSLCGAALVAAGQPGGLQFGSGATLVLSAAVCSGSYFALQRPLVVRYGAMRSAAMTLIGGGILLSPWLASGIADAAANPSTALVALYLGLGPGVAGYLGWMVMLDTFGAARSANFLYLVPPIVTAMSIPLTGHVPDIAILGGGAVTIAGVAIVNLSKARSSRPAVVSKG
jgi:EamA-like transporter family.